MPVVNVTPDPPAEDAAENFINTETQRIQNVLKASGAIGDEEIKSKIYEACMQRIQLLSNLRTLIQTAGAKSRLADFARNARSETERLTFVGKLFGDAMREHWAPGDARDVIVPAAPLDNEPETALRDASGKFTDQQRSRFRRCRHRRPLPWRLAASSKSPLRKAHRIRRTPQACKAHRPLSPSRRRHHLHLLPRRCRS